MLASFRNFCVVTSLLLHAGSKQQQIPSQRRFYIELSTRHWICHKIILVVRGCYTEGPHIRDCFQVSRFGRLKLLDAEQKSIWVNVFKNEPSKIYGRQPLKNWKSMVCLKQTIPLQGCLPQILLGAFLNNLSHLGPWKKYSMKILYRNS